MSITKLFTDTKGKKSRRIGRGPGSTFGKTAGRGTKGQKSRTGSNRKIKAWFEGGQTPLHRRTAKMRGFNHITTPVVELSTTVINHFYKDGEIVSSETMLEKGIIRKSKLSNPVKIILGAKLKPKVKFVGVKLTKSLE